MISGLDLMILATEGTRFGREFFGWSGRRPDLRGISRGEGKGWWRVCILVWSGDGEIGLKVKKWNHRKREEGKRKFFFS